MDVNVSIQHQIAIVNNSVAFKFEQEVAGILNSYLRDVFLVINHCIIGVIINLLGTVANILNVIVFIKQGFKDTVTISLMGLAISDLGCLLTLQWLNISFNPWFRYSSIPFESFETQYLTAGWPHVCFARITGLITAYITLERCLCIALPWHVKRILTPVRTFTIIFVIFIAMIGSTIPVYTVISIDWKFYPARNRILLGLVFSPNRPQVENAVFAQNSFFCYASFLAVIICTTVLAVKLKDSTKWRDSAASSKNARTSSTRDRRVVKMVVTLSIIFIICFLPTTVIFIATIVVPGLSFMGRYANLYPVMYSFSFILEAVNSSVNIIIYWNLSSKFRQVLTSLF